jgi:hypothetical protein
VRVVREPPARVYLTGVSMEEMGGMELEAAAGGS